MTATPFSRAKCSLWRSITLTAISSLFIVAGCASKKKPISIDNTVTGSLIHREKSRWVPVTWSSLPGWHNDNIAAAWPAWLRSCQKPGPIFSTLCQELRQLSNASPTQKRNWLQSRLQPYRVESHSGSSTGLLTAYYEPVLQARRTPNARFNVPLYAPPRAWSHNKKWYTRQQIDTNASARAALHGRALMYLADPIDAMILHIQGSGRVAVQEPNGKTRMVRMAFAGTNNQKFSSPSRWITAHGGRGGSWRNIRQWAQRNPSRVQAMLWSNPRYVFFREEAIAQSQAHVGPRGAQGVPLTPGRSIAVDKHSIPYGVPVWLSTSGGAANLNRLVLAQDTGSAIKGAVRADYFTGWSKEAAHLAHRMKQPLRLWVLWPK